MRKGQKFRKLKKEQREALITWLKDDLTLKEINQRAGLFTPPFQITRQQFYYYLGPLGLNAEELRADLIQRAVATKLTLVDVRALKTPKCSDL